MVEVREIDRGRKKRREGVRKTEAERWGGGGGEE